MKKLNIADLPWVEGKSPKGKFHRFRKDISARLGSARAPLPDSGRHPFEIELVKLPAGAINWPYHSHSVEHELRAAALDECGRQKGSRRFGPET